jgi:2-polyprenyl-6-hydroxyphenyl methylase/3-demethylubiquinone-9 3-methyltransferase
MSEGNQILSTRRFFDRQAASWASEYRSGGHMADRIARFRDATRDEFPEPGHMLDLGCGSGEIAAAFADTGWLVTACDLSPRMIETARARWVDERIDWELLSPGDKLPFPAASFDLVLCSSVLEYIDDLPAYLGEIARVLRPGGWCCATVPDMRHDARRSEAARRRIALNPLLFSLVRLSPWRSTYEYLRLSINRGSLAEWAALFRAASLEPVIPKDCEHPLALIMAQRRPSAT